MRTVASGSSLPVMTSRKMEFSEHNLSGSLSYPSKRRSTPLHPTLTNVDGANAKAITQLVKHLSSCRVSVVQGFAPFSK